MSIPIDLTKFAVADPAASAAMVQSCNVTAWYWSGVIKNESIFGSPP